MATPGDKDGTFTPFEVTRLAVPEMKAAIDTRRDQILADFRSVAAPSDPARAAEAERLRTTLEKTPGYKAISTAITSIQTALDDKAGTYLLSPQARQELEKTKAALEAKKTGLEVAAAGVQASDLVLKEHVATKERVTNETRDHGTETARVSADIAHQNEVVENLKRYKEDPGLAFSDGDKKDKLSPAHLEALGIARKALLDRSTDPAVALQTAIDQRGQIIAEKTARAQVLKEFDDWKGTEGTPGKPRTWFLGSDTPARPGTLSIPENNAVANITGAEEIRNQRKQEGEQIGKETDGIIQRAERFLTRAKERATDDKGDLAALSTPPEGAPRTPVRATVVDEPGRPR